MCIRDSVSLTLRLTQLMTVAVFRAHHKHAYLLTYLLTDLHSPGQTAMLVPVNGQKDQSATRLADDHTRQSSASKTGSQECADQ